VRKREKISSPPIQNTHIERILLNHRSKMGHKNLVLLTATTTDPRSLSPEKATQHRIEQKSGRAGAQNIVCAQFSFPQKTKMGKKYGKYGNSTRFVTNENASCMKNAPFRTGGEAAAACICIGDLTGLTDSHSPCGKEWKEAIHGRFRGADAACRTD